MNFDDILSAQLPDPRDDEPEDLRRDILDELADHLACSYRREILSGADAESAHRHALDRFGNPAAIAARLWLDAMKGKIMSQRILVASCVLLAISSVAIGGMSWIQWDRMSRAQAEQLAASQAMQDAMLKRMEILAKAIEHPRSPDWNPASFKLTEETLNGPPAVGMNVIFGKIGQNQESITRISDEKGVVDLDAVQPGGYHFSIRRTRKGTIGPWWTNGMVRIKPYEDFLKPIICPQAIPRHVPIRLRFTLSEEFPRAGLFLHASFHGLSRKFADGTGWDFHGREAEDDIPNVEPQGMGGGGGLQQPRLDFLFDLANGDITRIRQTQPYYSSDGTIDVNSNRGPGRMKAGLPPQTLGHVVAAIFSSDRKPISEESEVLEGDHPLSSLAILRLSEKVVSPNVESYDVISLVSFRNGTTGMGGSGGGMRYRGGRPSWMPEAGTDQDERPLDFGSASIALTASTSETPASGYIAEKDRVNTWTIEPPKDLIAAARNALKDEETAKVKKPESAKPELKEAPKPKN